jgi:hypothetical protein
MLVVPSKSVEKIGQSVQNRKTLGAAELPGVGENWVISIPRARHWFRAVCKMALERRRALIKQGYAI